MLLGRRRFTCESILLALEMVDRDRVGVAGLQQHPLR
jgi:hypothetical protein